MTAGKSMENRITQEEIRLANRQQIYRFIYDNGKASSPDICAALSLSRPTVASNLAGMEAEGLIRKDGLQDAGQVGRRAVVYAISATYRIAIGVEVLRTRANIIAVDLYGKQLGVVKARIPYANEPSYYEALCEQIRSFIRSMHFKQEQVLGICITMQGLVSPDWTTIVYGEILGNTGLKIDVFADRLPYPCAFVHDPAAAALSELQIAPEIDSVQYVSLSSHLGGATIVNRRIQSGKHGHHATFEHIRATRKGGPCYCGQIGCWDTLCSMPTLLGDEEPEDFFEQMRAGDKARRKSWRTFLKHLARLIKDLHLVNDIDIMLGGRLAPFMIPEDIDLLYKKIREICPFEEEDDFILLSKMPAYHIPTGAALHYIHKFLENV